MNILNSTHRPRLPRILLAALAAIIGAALFAGTWASASPARATAAATARHNDGPKPTIVLVHGAFADASGWAGTITRLEDRGYTVLAPANPLRGVPPTPPTSPASWPPSTDPSSWSGTPTAARSSPTPPPATPMSRPWSTSPPSPPTRARPPAESWPGSPAAC
jgi:pimeloyl-ACP methyl ester carboxylesterase